MLFRGRTTPTLPALQRTSLSLAIPRRLYSVPGQIIPRPAPSRLETPFFMGDNIVNFYGGQPPLNRLSFQREEVDKINGYLNDPDARFLVFQGLNPLVKKGEFNKTFFLNRQQVQPLIGDGYYKLTESQLENKAAFKHLSSARTLPEARSLVFLGVDDRSSASPGDEPAVVDHRSPKGTPYFAVDAPNDWQVEGGEWGDARTSSMAMDIFEAGVFAQGRALIDWNARNKYCPACGKKQYSLWAGWKRNCTTALEPPVEGKEPCFSTTGLHNFAYPRTDPVTIMGILNPAGDKILLGRNAKWPAGMYSCLAGFIEPGESFEDAVRREVLEEAGIEVGPVRYSSSQPWPYPSSLMVGCFGIAKDGQTIRLDLDNELEDAEWFSREEVAPLVSSPHHGSLSKADNKLLDNAQTNSENKTEEAAGSAKGLTRLPPVNAIAGQLIRVWVAGELDLVSRL